MIVITLSSLPNTSLKDVYSSMLGSLSENRCSIVKSIFNLGMNEAKTIVAIKSEIKVLLGFSMMYWKKELIMLCKIYFEITFVVERFERYFY